MAESEGLLALAARTHVGKLVRIRSAAASLNVWLDVVMGPAFEKKSTTTEMGARPDILARGVFGDQKDCYFDVVVTDTGCASKEKWRTAAVLREAESMKRRNYEERVRRMGASFTPLACSVYGTLAPESTETLATVLRKMKPTRDEKKDTTALHRMKLQAAIVKATALCLRTRLRTTPAGTTAATVDGEREAVDCTVAMGDLRGVQGPLF